MYTYIYIYIHIYKYMFVLGPQARSTRFAETARASHDITACARPSAAGSRGGGSEEIDLTEVPETWAARAYHVTSQSSNVQRQHVQPQALEPRALPPLSDPGKGSLAMHAWREHRASGFKCSSRSPTQTTSLAALHPK